MTIIATLLLTGALLFAGRALLRVAAAIERAAGTFEEQAPGILKASWLATTAKARPMVHEAQDEPVATPDGEEMQQLGRLAAAAERGVNEFLGAEIRL